MIPPARWRQRRAAAVVKLLALAPNHRLHREQLMDTLWPELEPSGQANNLRQALHQARAAFETTGLPRQAVLMREGEFVVLAPPNLVWVDALAFEHAVADAWSALTPGRAEAALSLYAGDLLPEDRYDDWAEQRRAALRASFLALLTRLTQWHLERQIPVDAIGVLHRIIAADPTHEPAYRSLMQAYAAIGQGDTALAQYDRLALALATDGLTPTLETTALAQQLSAAGARAIVPMRFEIGLRSYPPEEQYIGYRGGCAVQHRDGEHSPTT